MSIKTIDDTYVASAYARFPLEIVRGSGSLVWDTNGKEYIDMATGIAVNTFGVSDPVWAEAVTAQVNTLQHTSNLYYTEPCANLAKMLCEKTGMKKVFFSNSGAEANECAIKVARKYAADHHGENRNKIITLINSFHGRTITTLAATGQDTFHGEFLPLTPGFLYTPANDIAAITALMERDDVAAVMMEPVQGEGGVNPLDAAFVKAVAELAEKRDILIITDEVQCGNGRSGYLYGYMHYGITPDIVSTAKGLAGGLPLGATLMGEKVKDVLTPGSHGSTFGGNPVCCAGALSILSRLDENTLAGVRARAEYIRNELNGASGIRSITGLGLMLGVETEKDAGEIIRACMDNGVLYIKAKTKVRMLPALNIPEDQLKKAIAVLKAACAM